MAIGGSTNSLLHLPAIAARAGHVARAGGGRQDLFDARRTCAGSRRRAAASITWRTCTRRAGSRGARRARSASGRSTPEEPTVTGETLRENVEICTEPGPRRHQARGRPVLEERRARGAAGQPRARGRGRQGSRRGREDAQAQRPAQGSSTPRKTASRAIPRGRYQARRRRRHQVRRAREAGRACARCCCRPRR